MPARRWTATIVDSPDSDACVVVGALVVAVRTPRSQDFVTVEVAPAAPGEAGLARPPGVFHSSSPYPCLSYPWHGEVSLGAPVRFHVADGSYRLTLLRLSEGPGGAPWVSCDFCLERD